MVSQDIVMEKMEKKMIFKIINRSFQYLISEEEWDSKIDLAMQEHPKWMEWKNLNWMDKQGVVDAARFYYGSVQDDKDFDQAVKELIELVYNMDRRINYMEFMDE